MDIEIKKRLTKNWFTQLQDVICNEILELEKTKKFEIKKWNKSLKKNEGGGEFRILTDGKIFDKVGVNFS